MWAKVNHMNFELLYSGIFYGCLVVLVSVIPRIRRNYKDNDNKKLAIDKFNQSYWDAINIVDILTSWQLKCKYYFELMNFIDLLPNSSHHFAPSVLIFSKFSLE